MLAGLIGVTRSLRQAHLLCGRVVLCAGAQHRCCTGAQPWRRVRQQRQQRRQAAHPPKVPADRWGSRSRYFGAANAEGMMAAPAPGRTAVAAASAGCSLPGGFCRQIGELGVQRPLVWNCSPYFKMRRAVRGLAVMPGPTAADSSIASEIPQATDHDALLTHGCLSSTGCNKVAISNAPHDPAIWTRLLVTGRVPLIAERVIRFSIASEQTCDMTTDQTSNAVGEIGGPTVQSRRPRRSPAARPAAPAAAPGWARRPRPAAVAQHRCISLSHAISPAAALPMFHTAPPAAAPGWACPRHLVLDQVSKHMQDFRPTP